VVCETDPECIVVAREGCPVVIGLGIAENFVASDVAALLPVTRRFMFLEEGDVAEIRRTSVRILDAAGTRAARPIRASELPADAVERGQYRHFMLKEIHEQPRAIAQTLEERVAGGKLLDAAFGPAAREVFKTVKAVHIAACGTSFHAGLVASYVIEQICRIPARIEIASEYRYRDPVITPDTLFVALSQSGETADTLAALRNAKRAQYLSTLTICNVAESSMVRESDLVLLTRAGPEIGVASTKAFTTQLAALAMLTVALAKNGPGAAQEGELISQLLQLPGLVEKPSRTSTTRCFSAAARCTPLPWKARSNSRKFPTSTRKVTPRRSSSMVRWRSSTKTCRWWRWRPTTSCWRSSNPTFRRCAPAAENCSCSRIPGRACAAKKE
jgi:glutamine---fructose-6-phosphate transaminase (isomerizing)